MVAVMIVPQHCSVAAAQRSIEAGGGLRDKVNVGAATFLHSSAASLLGYGAIGGLQLLRRPLAAVLIRRAIAGRCKFSPAGAGTGYEQDQMTLVADDGDQEGAISSFELPALHSRFPLRLNPYAEDLREECESWGLSLLIGSGASPTQRQAFLEGRYHLCASLYLPAFRFPHRLALCSKFFAFGFMVDDVMELTPPQEADALLRASIAGWSDAEYQSQSWRSSKLATIFQRLKAEVFDGMYREMSPGLRARTERCTLEWFHTVGAEQCSARFQSFEEYMAFREIEIGARVYLCLVEYSLDIDVEELELKYADLFMVQFREAVLKHYILVNDLLSFRKEVIQHAAGGYQRGAIGILLAELQQQQAEAASTTSSSCSSAASGDLQRCIDKVWSMIQEQEVDILRLVKEIKARLPESASDLVKYVDGCCDSLASHMYWYTISGRYRLDNVKFLHGQPAGGRPTVVSLSPDDPTGQKCVSLSRLVLNQGS
ncbi:hypothetical protein L7F22_050678 [Adiantum nelumboides]|nr:hypothetical protein [Adiantum nelumboides]